MEPRVVCAGLTAQGSGVRGRRARLSSRPKTWTAPHPLQSIVRPRLWGGAECAATRRSIEIANRARAPCDQPRSALLWQLSATNPNLDQLGSLRQRTRTHDRDFVDRSWPHPTGIKPPEFGEYVERNSAILSRDRIQIP